MLYRLSYREQISVSINVQGTKTRQLFTMPDVKMLLCFSFLALRTGANGLQPHLDRFSCGLDFCFTNSFLQEESGKFLVHFVREACRDCDVGCVNVWHNNFYLMVNKEVLGTLNAQNRCALTLASSVVLLSEVDTMRPGFGPAICVWFSVRSHMEMFMCGCFLQF